MPNSCAIAGICNKEFVDPEIAACTIIAFSNAFFVTILLALHPAFASSILFLPASYATFLKSSQVAGISAEPGSIRPNASAIICMVDAVPINEQAPQDGQAWCL